MKSFYRIWVFVAAAAVMVFTAANIYLLRLEDGGGRPYRVEISRLAHEMEKGGLLSVDLSECDYITNIEKNDGSAEFYQTDSDYVIREVNGEYYRFDYTVDIKKSNGNLVIAVNLFLAVMAAVMIAVMLFVQLQILRPFERITNVPYELSRGNLVIPLKEGRDRFFGKFVWGVNLLRENMEQQKERELDLQRSRKMLLLSLSHDIKTPLSAIKLYAKALSKGLYQDAQKQLEIAENIDVKADEIEGFVSQLVKASGEDFLSFEIHMGEFYLSELMKEICLYYSEKLSLIRTDFVVGQYSDCLLSGDMDRSIEVLQNIMENAIKYGDGRLIQMTASQEEDCMLIGVSNSGCTLDESELPHIFDSFYRGSNAGSSRGSGLGLAICRELMHKMNGDIFAQIHNNVMTVTAVFGKA